MEKKSPELSEINIRIAGPVDADLLVGLGRSSFYEAFAEETAPEDMAEHLRKAFKAFDADNSGTLDSKELLAVLTRSGGGCPLTEKDAKSLIDEFDVNGVRAFAQCTHTHAQTSTSVPCSTAHRNLLFECAIRVSVSAGWSDRRG